MKKIIVTMLTVISITFSLPAHATEWKKSKPGDAEDSKAVLYSLDNTDGSICRVTVGSDGSIYISAADPKWHGKLASNFVAINQNGKITYSKVWVDPLDNPATEIHTTVEGGYQVFRDKCSTEAKNLPAEVRQKFHGTFGIR